MRVIAGIYRRRSLQGPAGLDARPTSDRLRETVFNILQPVIEGSRFMDLCAGSGAVGIEALSRGAAQVTFVEQARLIVPLIQLNLDSCGIPKADYQLIRNDALYLLKLKHDLPLGSQPWDLIYYDPPYDADYLPVLHFLGGAGTDLLQPDGCLMVEYRRKNALPDEVGALKLQRQVKQADSCVNFYRLN